jgi:hypothetical protein
VQVQVNVTSLVLWSALFSGCVCGPTSPGRDDAGEALDAGPAVVHCPAQLRDTGEPTGAAIDRDGFGCYGACGPSCKAECLDDTVTVSLPAGDGCATCTYQLKACKSHALCRWHDDCYRQCDLRWDALHAEAPASPPSNPCYLNCDRPVLDASALCGEDWAQLLTSTPSVRDACWDGSFVLFSTLTHEVQSTGACSVASDLRARPWAPDVGAWNDYANPPTTLPHGYSCSADTDCPDRNQVCDPDAGDYPGVNGWGRCVDAAPDADVTRLPPTALFTVDGGADGGAPCDLGYQCHSGRCLGGACAD